MSRKPQPRVKPKSIGYFVAREKAMQTYKTFRPTGFDAAGLGCEDRQEWLVAPCGTNRDASILQESNWYVQNDELDKIDPEGADHEVHRFGHWACGWFEIVLVRPGSACAKACEENEAALSDYSILSDDDHSEREHEAVYKWWGEASLRERVELCSRARVNIMAARRIDDIPERVYDHMRDRLE